MDDEIYRKARIKAAEQDTSVSALVRQFLVSIAEEGSEAERLLREERQLRERIGKFRASDRLPRDRLHERR